MADWDDLRMFLAVARSESLSGAGRVLKLDPATVGRRIARLEEALGARLFAKSPQGYALTDDGRAAGAPCRSAPNRRWSGALEELRGAAGALSGQIRIGAPDGCANYLLPQVLAAICDANPGLEVQIVALPRVFNLSKREADMAIAVSPPAAGRLTVQKLTDYRLHLAASRDYLARHPPIRQPRRPRRAPDDRLYPRHDLRQGTRLSGRDRRRDGAAGLEFGLGAAELAAAGRGGGDRA